MNYFNFFLSLRNQERVQSSDTVIKISLLTGDPDHGNDDCGYILDNWEWKDRSCTSDRSYLCELDSEYRRSVADPGSWEAITLHFISKILVKSRNFGSVSVKGGGGEATAKGVL